MVLLCHYLKYQFADEPPTLKAESVNPGGEDQIDGNAALLIAAIIKRTLLRFLISHRVPGALPWRLTDTFTSQRKDP